MNLRISVKRPIRPKPPEISPLAENMREQLAGLQLLAGLQRGLRLGLRAFWMGLGGFLLAWSINSLWGLLPSLNSWLLVGLLFGSLPLAGFALSLARSRRWVRLLDRRLELHEQVSTAWEVVERGQSGPISDALVSDVMRTLPAVQDRMLRRGWFLERDLVATLIVVLLAGLVFASNLTNPFSDLANTNQVDVPQPFDNNPFSQQAQQNGGQQPQASGQQGGSQEGSGDAPSGAAPSTDGQGSEGQNPDPSQMDPEALAEALGRMGERLSGEAPTFDLGQALEDMDLGEAAGALENLGDQMDRLSPETRENLAQAMEDAAEELQENGQESQLEQDLRDAADALREQNRNGEGSASDQMDQLAEDLRELEQQLPGGGDGAGGGQGEGSGSTGSPEPVERLPGEGEDFELPLEDASESGLLSPAPPDAAGDGTAEGSLDSGASGDDDVVHSPLVPNAYLWKWRDVVSSYFRR